MTDTTTTYTERMPDALADRCREALRKGESVRIAAATDLTEDLRFEERWLLVTDQRLLRFDSNGSGAGNGDATIPSIELSEASSAAVEELVGSGRINVVIGNEDVEVIRYTPSQRAKFARIARGIDQLIKDDPVDMQGEVDKTRCDRCGRLLAEPNGICSACTNRLAMMGRIARYAQPFKAKLALMVFLSLLFTLAELGPPYIMRLIIDDVLGNPDAGASEDPFAFLYLLVGAYAVIRLVSFVLEIFKDRLPSGSAAA